MTHVSDASAFGKVAVLFGGDSPERPVSLDSGRSVAEALCGLGVDAELFDPAERDLSELSSRSITRCWNALHGGAGEDGRVVGALNMMGLPFTGSGVLGSALAMDKVRSKQVLAHIDIRVPLTLAVNEQTPTDEIDFPVFVKPANGGSSISARPARDAAEWASAYASAKATGQTVLVEPLLDGPEYTVGILQGKALPAIRIEADAEFYDYDAKYVSDATRFVCPALADQPDLEAHLAHVALASFDALGCEGWGRVDFMLNHAGEPYVLEVNTVPGMTSHSLVPCAAAATGIDFPTLCWKVLETSFPDQPWRQSHGE
ncbi:MAG: D-alanine--D-alanine ligase [Woeseiaceae bacterium]